MSESYRLLAEHAAFGVALLDDEGRILYANPAMSDLLGIPVAGLAGRKCIELLAAAKHIDMAMSDAELDGARVKVVSAHRREHGEERFRRLLANLPAVAWESDWSGIMAKLRGDGIDSIEKLKAAIRDDPDYFGDTASHVRVLAVNRAAMAMAGVSDRAGFQKWITRDAFTHEMAQKYVAAVAPVVFGQQPTASVDVRLKRASGEPADLLLHVAPNENWQESPSLIVSALDVTDRKRAEERFRRLFLNLPVAAWESDWSGVIDYCARNGITTAEAFEAMIGEDSSRFEAAGTRVRVLAINPVALDLLGVKTQEEFEQWNGYAADSARRFASAAAALLFGGQRTVSVELQLLRADGVMVDVSLHLARGEVTVITIALDISEAKRAERALVAAKAYVDSLIETANVLVVELDLDAHVTRINRMGEDITGYKREELRDRNWFLALAPPGQEEHCDDLMVMLRNGLMPVSDEASIIARDGRERMIAWRNTNIFDESEKLIGVLSFGVDITGRREAQIEQERLQHEIQLVAEEWRLTFDTVRTPILITDTDGLVMRANQAAVDLTGRRFSGIVAQPITSIRAGEPWQTAAELVKHIGEEGYDTTAETKDANGRTWDLSVSRFEAGLDQAPRVIVVLWEITSVVELQESLRRSETMSAMGAIVAGVAHEIRNPLFGISATLDAYAAELRSSGYEELARSLRSEVTRLTTVTQELLDYGKPSALQIARGDLRDVVDAVTGRAALPRADVAVDNAVPRELPPLLMDAARMRQVFENLIDNAMQHAPSGSIVRVSAAIAENAGRHWVECRVEDNGPGFSAQDLDRVFEPFYTKRQGGTGLGLSIVQRIVQEHSGKVSAGNRPGGGAAVTILLPIAGA